MQKPTTRTRLPKSTLFLKGVEEELTVHPDLPLEPSEGVEQADEHNGKNFGDQGQDQNPSVEFPERELQAFY